MESLAEQEVVVTARDEDGGYGIAAMVGPAMGTMNVVELVAVATTSAELRSRRCR